MKCFVASFICEAYAVAAVVQSQVGAPFDANLSSEILDWSGYSALLGLEFARDQANGQFVRANSGHWKCWQHILRDYHFGYRVKTLYSQDDENLVGEIWTSTMSEQTMQRASYHADAVNMMMTNGMPVSATCCLPMFGTEGKSDCWVRNSMGADLCCGKPVLPKRCFGAQEFAFEVNADGDIVSGAWFQGITDENDCASLDDLSIYFQGKVFGGSDKGSQYHDYLRHAERFVKDFKASGRVLEFGVHQGHSLAMWSIWFPDGQIVGVDINDVGIHPQLIARGANITGNVRILRDDATSQDFVDRLGEQQFDVIVDDASHLAADQIKSFEMLFASKHLTPGGMYWIEDLFEATAHEYFISLSSYLVSRQQPLIQFVDDSILHNVARYDWRNLIHSVNIRNKMVIIEKRKSLA